VTVGLNRKLLSENFAAAAGLESSRSGSVGIDADSPRQDALKPPARPVFWPVYIIHNAKCESS
jgi:hypothetical protein